MAPISSIPDTADNVEYSRNTVFLVQLESITPAKSTSCLRFIVTLVDECYLFTGDFMQIQHNN